MTTNDQIIAVLESQHLEIARRLDKINGTLEVHDTAIDALQIEQGKLITRLKDNRLAIGTVITIVLGVVGAVITGLL